jgi:diaminopimelate decarboxylase
MPKVEIGDIIAFKDVGAYTEACESQYCLHPRPASVLVNKEKIELVRRKDNFVDLISREIIPERLFQKGICSKFQW